MTPTLYYEFLSQVIVSILITALAIAFWVSYKNSAKPYLRLISLAAVIEAVRVVPDYWVTVEIDNVMAIATSVTFQFLGSFLLLYALLVANSASRKKLRTLIASIVLLFVVGITWASLQDPFVQPSLARDRKSVV